MIRRTAIYFGLFALITGALTVYIGAQIAKIQLGDTYSVTAEFTDVTGLNDGDDVKIAGVKVGQVSGIEVHDDDTAIVTLSLEEDVQVPTDSEASVRWRNLLGQRIVYLEPGDEASMLEDGDEVERTHPVVDIGALINELGGLVSAIDPQELNELLGAVEGALNGNEANIDLLLDSAGSLLEVLAEREDTIGQLLEDFDTVATALADRDSQIRSMIDNLSLLTQTFASSEDLLDSTLTELATYSTGLDQALTGNEQELLSIVANLADVTDILRDNIDVVEAQLVNLPGGLAGLHDVTNRGEFIVVQALCFATGPPPCPTPTTLPGGQTMGGDAAFDFMNPAGPGGTSGLPAPGGSLPGTPSQSDGIDQLLGQLPGDQ